MEINLDAPGWCRVDYEKSKVEDDVIEPVYSYSKETQEIADTARQIMIDVETDFFRQIGSPLIGRAASAIAPYWKH